MIDKSVYSRTAKESTIFSKRGAKMERQIFFQRRANETKIDNDRRKREIKMSGTFDSFNVVGYICKKRESDISFCASA